MFLTYAKLLKSVSAGFCLGLWAASSYASGSRHASLSEAVLHSWVKKTAYVSALRYSLSITCGSVKWPDRKRRTLRDAAGRRSLPHPEVSFCVTTESRRHTRIGCQTPSAIGYRHVTEAGVAEGSCPCQDGAGQCRAGRRAGGYGF